MDYEIWVNDGGCAVSLGFSEGATFRDACERFASNNLNFSQYFDIERMTYFGRRLFDNESDARGSFR
ncbi:hypothetical protein [Nitrospira sp. BLG_1]|uniref:hypothetical protein n=1 Tax=Nitrospira sp. BLG_1 TaxID=3395883 RepID=UPI0039BD7653